MATPDIVSYFVISEDGVILDQFPVLNTKSSIEGCYSVAQGYPATTKVIFASPSRLIEDGNGAIDVTATEADLTNNPIDFSTDEIDPYVIANDESEIPTIKAGKRFFYKPYQQEFFGVVDGSFQEWWSVDPWVEGAGVNDSTVNNNNTFRRFNGMSHNFLTGIPIDRKKYRGRMVGANDFGTGYLEVRRGSSELLFTTTVKVGNRQLNQNYGYDTDDAVIDNRLSNSDTFPSIWLRWRGTTVDKPQLTMRGRVVLDVV